MQRTEPIDEEGWNAVMQDLCFATFRCASNWKRFGEEDDLDELAGNGRPAAETTILMNTGFRNPPVCKFGGLD